LIDAINRARQPFNVNTLAQAAAIAALEDDEHLRKTIVNNQRGLDRLAEIMRRVGAHPTESHANFVWAELDRPAKDVFTALLRKGIIVRTGDPFGKPNSLRVSVGTDQEMDAFELAFVEVMQAVPAR
jgi:histidinol-phosphate aminotransferase